MAEPISARGLEIVVFEPELDVWLSLSGPVRRALGQAVRRVGHERAFSRIQSRGPMLWLLPVCVGWSALLRLTVAAADRPWPVRVVVVGRLDPTSRRRLAALGAEFEVGDTDVDRALDGYRAGRERLRVDRPAPAEWRTVVRRGMPVLAALVG